MKKLFRQISAVFGVILMALLPVMPSAAQSSNALSITPRKDYNIRAGESVSDTLTITNPNTSLPLVLKLRVLDFSAKDETGSPSINRDTSVAPTAWSLKGSLDLPDQVSIDAGKTVNVPIKIIMNKNMGAGSYYSAIEYAAVTPTGDSVTISASGITLVFVTVPGQAKQLLNFEQFGAFIPSVSGDQGSFAGIFLNSQPQVLAYRLQNQGNIAEQPKGSILVKDFFGKTIYTIVDANPKNQLALRGQSRRFDTCIKSQTDKNVVAGGTEIQTVSCVNPGFKPGRYSAELSLLYGVNGNQTREITAKAYFWYLPWWFIGVIVVILLVIAGAGFYVVRRVKDVRSRKTHRR